MVGGWYLVEGVGVSIRGTGATKGKRRKGGGREADRLHETLDLTTRCGVLFF